MLVTASRSTEVPVPPSHRKALNTRLASLARELTDWAAVGADLFAADPKRAPIRLSRVLNARVQSQIQPRIGLLSGLVDRPFSHAREAIPYWPQLHPALRLINWAADGGRLVEDKLVTAERYAASNVAAAPILAVVGRNETAHPHEGRFPALYEAHEVVELLRGAPDEIVVKPAIGSRGGGVAVAARQGNAWLVEGSAVTAERFAARLLAAREPAGLLIQPRLRSHPSLAPFGGEFGLCTVRITTALLKGGPVLFFQFLKLFTQPGITDNFRGGSTGNLLAAVDENSGRISAVYRAAPGRRFLLSTITHHPTTGARLTGQRLPMWQDALDLALRAAGEVPECPLAGADVALTEDGPRILEINAAWDGSYAELTKGVGLRRMLRLLWPELAIDDATKRKAAKLLNL